MELNFFESSLELEFEKNKERKEEFLQEFLTSNNYVNLNKWKKLASRVEFSEGEELIFDLLLDIKQELFYLKNEINKTDTFLVLEEKSLINGVNFSHIRLRDKCLQVDEEYYGKIIINSKKISFFFKALSENEAKITQIKSDDESIYNGFIVDVQRMMIKILKEQTNG